MMVSLLDICVFPIPYQYKCPFRRSDVGAGAAPLRLVPSLCSTTALVRYSTFFLSEYPLVHLFCLWEDIIFDSLPANTLGPHFASGKPWTAYSWNIS